MPRTSGFGLNTNQGFRPLGTGGTILPSGGGGSGGTNFADLIFRANQERQTQKRQFDFENGQQARNLAQQRDLFAQGQLGDTQRAQLAFNANVLPNQLRQQRFDRIYPTLQAQLEREDTNERVGGQSGPSPGVTVGPVWGQNQIQQQVNAARATNDASTQSQMKSTQQDLSGRGFSATSPLLRALQSNQQMSNIANNAGTEREIRWNAAEGNARQRTASETLREEQFANRQQEDIERRKQLNNNRSALYAALAGIV